MALVLGTRLGVYEVTARIGAGGMGEVYRARDTNLNRDVALKVLPDAFANDAGRLARFTREAQTLAALNHPNIAHIHGLEDSTSSGQASNVRALVMELVEGEDLSQRIAHGAIPLDDALPIAKQIADALEAAHDQGIIHRDLKPANIKVRPDGVVKVLDFGLAKALSPEGASATADAMNSPTLTSPAMTQAGMILGTAAYMSPEQARGRVVDRRADIWAFGVVCFEMLTGRRAFPGGDVTDTIVSVVSKEPDWGTLPAVPAGLRRLLVRCLKKDPKARLRDIGEARVQIEELLSAPEAVAPASDMPTVTPTSQPRPALSRALPWMLAASTIVFAMAWLADLAPWRIGSSTQTTALRLTPLSFEQGGQNGAVWSPDGKAVAFGARQTDTDVYQIYVRYLDSPVATQITHLTAGGTPFGWTSTGRIAFFSARAAWSVSPVGGEPEKGLANDGTLELVSVGSVSRDGTAGAALYRGKDGLTNLWTSQHGAVRKPYEPAPFASRTVLAGAQVKFSPDGNQILVFRNAGAGEEAWLMPFPANAAAPPHRILQGLPAARRTPTFSWMPDNRRVVLSAATEDALEQLYMADTISGAFTVFSSGTRGQRSPAVSPDGTRLVFLDEDIDYDVVSLDLATAAVEPLIVTQRSEEQPAWAAGGSALVYVTDRNGPKEIWLHTPGQRDRPLVTASDFPADTTGGFMGPTLSPDATRVIYMRLERNGPGRLWMSAVAGGQPVPLVTSAGERDYPGSWSPDGKWYVYRHVQDNRESLNRVKTTGQAEPAVLKADVKRLGNWVPMWSPSDEWILYSDAGVKLISPDGKTTRDVSPKSAMAYAFSADGQTIYGIRQVDRQLELFSTSVAGGGEKTIGSLRREYLPASSQTPALRLTLTPDRRSVTYSTVRSTSNLWLMEGLQGITVR